MHLEGWRKHAAHGVPFKAHVAAFAVVRNVIPRVFHLSNRCGAMSKDCRVPRVCPSSWWTEPSRATFPRLSRTA